MKRILSVLFVFGFAVLCNAPDARADLAAEEAAQAELIEKTAIRDTLRRDLTQIASERTRCQRQKTNWTAATIVGGVGVAATGTAAIIQGNKIADQKQELRDLQRQ